MNTKTIFSFVILMLLFFSSCEKEELTGTNISQLLELQHKGATMPILVEGNIDSDVIILWVHGGPGYSGRIFNTNVKKFTDPLEAKYAVAYWDQRMAGGSRANQSSPKLSLELMTEDLGKVVELLRFKFGNDKKIFLFGHSWGGLIGTNYLAGLSDQESISGWIEVGGSHDNPRADTDVFNLIDKVAKEQIAKNTSVKEWQKLLERLTEIDRENMDSKQLDKLMDIGFEAVFVAVADGLVNKEAVFDPENLALLYSYFFYDQSSLSAKANIAQLEVEDFYTRIHPKLSVTNLLNKIKIPSLLMYGKYDFIVPPGQGEEAYELISTAEADKTYILYERSGHFPFDSEAELFLIDLLEFVEKNK